MASITTGKTPKHRASRAFERCRARKVRCDIVHRSERCTNCELDHIQCVEVHARRRKRGTGRRIKTTSTPALAYATPSEDLSGSGSVHDAPDTLPPTATEAEEAADASTVEQNQFPEIAHQEDGHPLPDSNEDLFPDFTIDLLKNGNETNPLTQAPETRLLPPFIAPIRSYRTFQYHEFLHEKGALAIPPKKIRNAILMRYVEFAYPQLPLADFHHVLQAVATDGREGKVGLLLFQAIMLAGSPFVDAEYIFEAGYPSRMALRQELAEKVRLLFDFDCETDRLILVQSAILMTGYQEHGDSPKHLRYFIAIAYNIALLLGLNKDPSSLRIPAKQKHLRKRIWWSLYMRDRTLSLGLRQNPVIAFENCELPELEIEDFDVQPASPETCSMLEDCGLLRDLDQQTRLGEVYMAQLELSHHLANVLKSRYTAIAPKLGSTRLIALVLVPKGPHASADTSDIQTCSERLDQWFRDLPDSLRYRTPLSLYFSPGQDILILHCGILNLFYYALVCALHRPYPSPILRNLAASEMCSQRKARHAANAISSILEEFQIQDLIGFMPSQGLTFMLQAAVTHLCDSTSKTAHLRSQSHHHLEACLEILDALKDVHSYARYATDFLTSAAAKLYRRSRSVERFTVNTNVNANTGTEVSAGSLSTSKDGIHNDHHNEMTAPGGESSFHA
ncbi:uncharacterized protein Z518_01872 [Rhinocladiella mackenziei CBS 650.93]|uniref:Xylanolytic transcriptional activator regulatory domain-containing protein n=1 Tax=Rhinocladiella mackenziei CBS 650.93 TaxID=1442369 RepID=A0A0D2IN20_9EURO|nr:uncharacterized protein Z518_01872 [Rhinocladiella mackenziei CBS 650.93]KIX07219.1 hypothetical protein Z518_01872 [Rhinocladiella mackenziei CBS 650.93]